MYSVIIPTFKRHADLYKCLSCLAEYFEPGAENQPFTVEVIVSDDARQKELRDHLSVHFPWVRYFEGPSRGPAANRNNGAAHASGEWLVFTDDDCLPGKGWLHAFHARAGHATVLEGRTIADRPKQRLDEESPLNFSGGYLWSCNFALRKSLFDSIGGFDENFPFPAMEDVDFKRQIDAQGAKISFVPDAVVTHPWRRVRGVAFMEKHQKSDFYFWAKHKSLAPASLSKYYAYMGLRSLVKVTIPGAIKYRCRGLKTAMTYDAWHLFQSLKFLFHRAG